MQLKKIHYSSPFFKELGRLTDEELKIVEKREKIFLNNCFDSRLKTHKLRGKWENYWSFSITFSKRIVFRFLKEGEVLFLKIGDHSIYQ